MAMISGVVQGTVTDALDPLRKGRVRLRLIALASDSPWALNCVEDLRPGDNVIVAFEGGDANRPVVVGKLPS